VPKTNKLILRINMNVLSLFDGISCGRQALKEARIAVGDYYASEVDKYAVMIANKNFPDTVQLGDVSGWRNWNIDWSNIHLLIGGSPCQGFSFAGNGLAFDDPRSGLFFVFVEILNHIKTLNPDIKFLLENVRMKQGYLDVISGCLGVQPVMINSRLLSAQNRVRYYWVNWPITQPVDLGITLDSILECGSTDLICGRVVGRKINPATGCRDDYNITLPTIQRFEPRLDNKSGCLTTVCKDNMLANRQNYIVTRRFTPTECERLQTLPDNYTLGISDNQRYKALGNGWTIDVVAHILRGL
jgi:site-specific DNA-cytosine methylase